MPSVGWLVTAALVATRLMAVVSIMPVLSIRSFPNTTRVLLCVLLTFLLTPHLPTGPTPSTLPTLIYGIASEALLGIIIGGTVRIAYDALALAGQFIDSQVGQAAAVALDPTLQVAQGPIARLAALLAAAVFLGTDVHLQFLVGVADSFHVIPPGAVHRPLAAGTTWLDMGAMMIQAGFRLASPIIVFVFLMNLFVATITRLAPQMNLYFSLGFILTIFGGEAIFLMSLPHILDNHLEIVRDTLARIPALLEIVRVPGG